MEIGGIMAENGKKLITFVGSLLGSFLAVTLAIYNLVYAPLSKALATECEKRETCVKDLQCSDNKLELSLNSNVKEQMLTNQKLLVMVARIETKIGGLSGRPK